MAFQWIGRWEKTWTVTENTVIVILSYVAHYITQHKPSFCLFFSINDHLAAHYPLLNAVGIDTYHNIKHNKYVMHAGMLEMPQKESVTLKTDVRK